MGRSLKTEAGVGDVIIASVKQAIPNAAGKDAGKRGTVERVIRRAPSPTATRSVYRRGSHAGGVSVVVEGLNIAKRHTKPRQTSGTSDRIPKVQQGGIMDIAQPLPISKV